MKNVLFFLIIVLLVSCNTSTSTVTITTNPIVSSQPPIPVETAQPTSTEKELQVTLQPATKDTGISVVPFPTPSIKSTALVITPSPFTPLPTLGKGGILELIDNNGGCRLPCWWGIEPGQTNTKQALSFLSGFSQIRLNGETGSSQVDGKIRFVAAYKVQYDLPGSSDQGEFGFLTLDGIVSRISVGPKTTQYRFTLDQLLSKMGKPSQIFIEAKYDAMGYTIPFHLILYYPQQRFFANYYLEAEQIDKNIRACPAKSAPGLIMWSRDLKVEDHLAVEMLGPDSKPGLQNFEEATGQSIDNFYRTFRNPLFRDCVETPMVFWENLK